MDVTIHLPSAVESQIRRKAAEGGLSLEAYLRLLAERDAQHPSDDPASMHAPDDDELRPWRGVLVLSRPRRALFSEPLDFSPRELPKRRPTANMNWHRMRSDDE